ncbi:MAG: F0F1 ATP synthase subunit epsilon, partial [Alphaproteobacteria bacterium]
MRLRILTPVAEVLAADATIVRALDATGAFAILPGHADFVTVLGIGVLGWRGGEGGEHFAALRHGVLRVTGGDTVTIATREAHVGDDLAALERELVAEYLRRDEEEAHLRTRAVQLHAAAMRRLQEVIAAGREPVGIGGQP